MPWNSPIAFITGTVLTAAQLNNMIGPSGNISQTMPALATTAGQIAYATGPNAIAMAAAGSASQLLHGGTAPAFAALAWTELPRIKRSMCYQSTNVNVGSNQTLTWDTNEDNADSMHAAGGSAITVPNAGCALVYAFILWQPGLSGNRFLDIYKNGTILFKEVQRITGEQFTQEVAVWATCAANDYFEVRATQTGQANLAHTGGNAYNGFGLVLVP